MEPSDYPDLESWGQAKLYGLRWEGVKSVTKVGAMHAGQAWAAVLRYLPGLQEQLPGSLLDPGTDSDWPGEGPVPTRKFELTTPESI